MNTTLTTVLYTSKTLSDGTHPLMLRLTKNRRIKYISLHLSLDAKFWDFDKGRPKRNCPDKERINALIETKTKELQEQILDFKTNDKEYTLNTLVEKASCKVVRKTVGDYLNDYITRLLAEKRVGNAKTFQELRTSLTKFCCSLDFYFIDIDTEWLKHYEQWLRVEKHYSDNSIGIRFRSLRVLYNSAITDGLIRKTDYPFDTFKVSRFKEATAKRSLTKEDIRRIMDCERKDPNKRIAFTNDEKRIKCYTEICGFPYERAVSYTTVGCNEPAFLGAISGSNSKGNVLRCVETLFHKKSDAIVNIKSFDEFYKVFERELYSDLDIVYDYDNKYNLCRSRDVNYISSLFFNDCIENAKSLTQGGGDVVIASPMLLGIVNVIDSLAVVKQFVFDEEKITMTELVNAVKSNWIGYEELKNTISKTAKFFGNDDETSNSVAQRFYNSLYEYLKDKKNLFGYQWLVGDLVGYNEHHKWFGNKTKATPDGRYDGDNLKFGLEQGEGRDREGLTALLNSIAAVDEHAIACGSTVTNISLDEQLIKNDDNFEKTVNMFETYFKNGGVHFQLTYVSKEDLLAAKANPKNHQNLRVRVTGFSE